MRSLTILFICCLFAQISFAQSGKTVAQTVSTYRTSGVEFKPVKKVFKDVKSNVAERPAVQQALSEATFFDINTLNIQSLRTSNETAIQMRLPITPNEEVELELVQVEVFAPDFKIRTSDGLETYDQKGVHYRGIIKGDNTSLASISVFEDEVMGFFSNNDGNYIIGKLQAPSTSEHIVYLESDLLVQPNSECAMPDDGIPYKKVDLEPLPDDRDAGDCVTVFIEVDNDIYNNKGSGTQAYVEGFFAQSATLYANESINVAISDVLIWTTNSPYTQTSSTGLLSQFQARYSNSSPVPGNIGHLISYDGSGGVAAGFSGVCNPTNDQNMCFSGIQSSYSTVPTYSWTVQVFTHEMGHLFGSRHTHACVWNGNNTAIDGCAGQTEGSCSLPGSPSGGGTIMSYCHFTTGISFNNGFGSQPGNVIRNRVAGASCLAATCGGSGPTCNDGVQNGDETGVDCGGSCPACPTNCNENTVTLTITLDNYPEETSWTITSGGTTYASGGTYGNQSDGSTITINECLADGCYDFTINDAYGDGICCGYGNGSYSLTDDSGSVLASGGQFTSSETTNFCLNGAPAPTCDDGVQNGDEEGVDCGGSNCPACPSCSDGIQNQGEEGVDCGGPCPACPTSGCETINFNDYSINSYGGSQDGGTSSVIGGGTGLGIFDNAWKSISLNYTITANTIIEFEFGSTVQGEIHGIGFDGDNSISSNLTFKLYGTQNWGITNYDNYNNLGYWEAYTIPVGQFYTGNADRLFFVADHDGGASNGNTYFQNIKIYEGSCGSAMPNADIFEVGTVEIGNDGELEFVAAKTKVYPNPATNVINVDLAQSSAEAAQISIIDMYGKVVRQHTAINEISIALEINDLTPGLYLVKVENGDETTVEKVVVK